MHTPFLPSLRHQVAPMGSRIRAATRSLSPSTLLQIEERLGPALKDGLLKKPATKAHSRERIFSLARTFWCWIWQALQANTSCREVVRQVQTLFAVFSDKQVDEGTSAYCRARKKLAAALLEKAMVSSARSAEGLAPRSRLLQGRPLKFVDGTGLRVADTDKNRAAFPRSKNQFAKPSFPIMKVVALFSSLSGAIIARAVGSILQSELRLLMGLRPALAPGDILGGDRHFGSYVLAAWLQGLKVDILARLATRARHVDFAKALQLHGPQDGLFVWRKPARRSPLLTAEEWDALPAEITVRILRTSIQRPGFRTSELTVMTTLLDAALYPREEILSAYLRRWRMELCLDDLKTTLGMEMLHCQSPQLLASELLVHLSAHNLVRWMMAGASQLGGVDPDRISFKGTLDAFRQWSAGVVQVRGPGKKKKQASVWRKFLLTLAADLLPLRPGRQEPRAVKKRSKYPVLNKPRRQYIDRWSRNRRRRVANAKRAAVLK